VSRYTIVISERAKADVEGITRHIAADSLDTAARWLTDLEARIEMLSTFQSAVLSPLNPTTSAVSFASYSEAGTASSSKSVRAP